MAEDTVTVDAEVETLVVKVVEEGEDTAVVVDNRGDCGVETEDNEVCKRVDRFAAELNDAVVSI